MTLCVETVVCYVWKLGNGDFLRSNMLNVFLATVKQWTADIFGDNMMMLMGFFMVVCLPG